MTRAQNQAASFLRFAAFLAVAVFALVVSPRARAETYMTVGDVSVDVTAKNAAAARDQAIATAQRKAFDKLMKRLVPNASEQARLTPGQAEIESFVQDFAIDNERVSAVRYIGLYSVRFRASLIHKYLSDAGVTSVGDLQQVLVVPIYRTAAGHLLWEQNNAWRAAWDHGGFGDGPVTLLLPNADAFDTGTLSIAAAENGDSIALGSLIRRYRAAGAVIVTAESRDAMHGGAASGLNIDIATYDPAGRKTTQQLTIDPVAGEPNDKTLLRGVSAVAAALENNWGQAIASTGSTGLKGSSAAPDAAEAQPITGAGILYTIAMPLAGISEWVKLRDQLGAMPGVQLLTLDALTRDGAALTLDFAGDTLALQAALAGTGYVLVQTAPGNAAGPGSFLLRTAGAPSALRTQ